MTETPIFNPIGAGGGIPAFQPMSGTANPDVFDLRQLCDRCMGNLDLVQRVLNKFEQRLPEELAELERVLELGNAAEIALVAHRIKGNASNISAAGVQQAAAEIEDLGRAGRVADIDAHLRGLREQWRRYVDCRATLWPSATNAALHSPAPT